jgi:type I restriction enzyme M protein
MKAVLSALSERDQAAEVCLDKAGNPEPDPELRDTETVPLPGSEDPTDTAAVPRSVREFFDREVKPHVPDAWIDLGKRDVKDGKVGIVGYEINFNRYFYRYTPPRPLEEIEADIRGIEKDIMQMLSEVTRNPSDALP